MNFFEAGLIDVYDNIERRMGDHAWMLPFAVAAGSFLVQKMFFHRSTGKAEIKRRFAHQLATHYISYGTGLAIAAFNSVSWSRWPNTRLGLTSARTAFVPFWWIALTDGKSRQAYSITRVAMPE